MAALSCYLIDLLAEVATDKSMTADQLREQINDIKEQKDELIKNPIERRLQYAITAKLFLQCDPKSPNKSPRDDFIQKQ